MNLYIANATNQVQTFMYTMPEVTNARQQQIAIGGQIKISGDLNPQQVDAIISHHAIYGMRKIDELNNISGKKVPLICSEKPIPVTIIQRMVLHNTGVLGFQGETTRKELALGVDSLMRQRELEEGTAPIEKLHIHLEEDTRKGIDSEINEIITVDRSDNPAPPQKTRRGKVKGF